MSPPAESRLLSRFLMPSERRRLEAGVAEGRLAPLEQLDVLAPEGLSELARWSLLLLVTSLAFFIALDISGTVCLARPEQCAIISAELAGVHWADCSQSGGLRCGAAASRGTACRRHSGSWRYSSFRPATSTGVILHRAGPALHPRRVPGGSWCSACRHQPSWGSSQQCSLRPPPPLSSWDSRGMWPAR